jgi:triosephosphate isomerase
MPQLIAGNWKMNGLLKDGTALASALRDGCVNLGCDLLVCPPATLLHSVAGILAGSPIAVGGQDCHAEPHGAHTGDISAPMLRDVGASWVIVGHSERRAEHHETDEIVREKALAAIEAGLTPIVCVGETDEHRLSGRETEVVGWQLVGSLPKGFTGVVAYEPIWAIGTGNPDSPASANAIMGEIRALAGLDHARILYGGSMKPDNVAAFLAQPNIDGGLVGGASLEPDSFAALLEGARA